MPVRYSDWLYASTTASSVSRSSFRAFMKDGMGGFFAVLRFPAWFPRLAFVRGVHARWLAARGSARARTGRHAIQVSVTALQPATTPNAAPCRARQARTRRLACE